MIREEFDSGKYVVIFGNDGSLTALRNGQPWRDMTGDKLFLSMLQEVETIRRKFALMIELSRHSSPINLAEANCSLCGHERHYGEGSCRITCHCFGESR